ncbi:hypothetical protein D3C81_1835500 [compost metagenome]
MPAGQRCQSLAQGTDRQRLTVFRQVADDAFRSGRQIPTPRDLEVLDRRTVAFTRVLSRACRQVPLRLIHLPFLPFIQIRG